MTAVNSEQTIKLQIIVTTGGNLRRYIFLLSIGAILCIGAQITLSIQVHPENKNALIDVLPAIICLILGGAVTVSGLLGLADNYESLWAGLPNLLEKKYHEKLQNLPLNGISEAQEKSREFWKAYRRISFSVCLIMGGILTVSAQMMNTPLLSYLFYIAGATGFLGLVSLSLGGPALSKVRASHAKVKDYVSHLHNLPDASEVNPPTKMPNGRGYVMWTNRDKSTKSRRVNRSDNRSRITQNI